MKKPFSVVEFADQVTAKYIKTALQHCYYGTGYEDNFSDKLIRVLLSDYKKKAKNLAWYLKDADGRVRNYITLQPEASKVVEDASKNSQTIRDILNWLQTVNAEFTPEDFIKNKCVIDKQSIKITKAIKNRDLTTPYSKEIIRDKSLAQGLKADIDFSGYLEANKGKIPASTGDLKKSNLEFSPFGVFCTTSSGLFLALIPAKFIKVSVTDSLSKLDTNALAKVFGNIGAEQMKVSIDIADMITCSTGNSGSCLSVDNCHHSGAIINFRSDFALIAFTNDPKDRLIKRGRSWVFLRLTEGGFKRRTPFWKQQQAYGSVSDSHSALLRQDIRDKTVSELGYDKKYFSSRDRSIEKKHSSPNVDAAWGSHTEAPGHIDTSGSGRYAWMLPKSCAEFDYNKETLLSFPDMLDLKGELTNAVNFRNSKGSSGYYGSLNPNNYEVTCKITKDVIMSSDAIEVDGAWYSQEGLKTLLSKDVETPPEPETPTVVEEVKEPKLDLDSVNVDDF